MDFVLSLQEEVLGESILLSNSLSHYFIDFPMCLVAVWLEETVTHHGSIANEADGIRHSVGLHEALRDLGDLIDVVASSSRDAIVEDLFCYSSSKCGFDHI